MHPPVLHMVQPGYPFVLFVDTSDVGLGVILAQHNPQDEWPIQCLSHQLTATERWYAVIEKRP